MEILIGLFSLLGLAGLLVGVVLIRVPNKRQAGKTIATYSVGALAFAFGSALITAPNRSNTELRAEPKVQSNAQPITAQSEPTPPVQRDCRVTLAQYSSLSAGMSYHHARSLLGCSGTEISRVDMAGYSTVMYTWSGAGSFVANMNAMFQNDRLVSKAQFGLR